MFRPFAPAVVPLDAKELAVHDGSEQAEGRGSGKDPDPRFRQRIQEPIPYMGMVYGPIERRLDTAIFRALFASSARQARQFVIHGSVRVNGKRVGYFAKLFGVNWLTPCSLDDIPRLSPQPRRHVPSRP